MTHQPGHHHGVHVDWHRMSEGVHHAIHDPMTWIVAGIVLVVAAVILAAALTGNWQVGTIPIHDPFWNWPPMM